MSLGRQLPVGYASLAEALKERQGDLWGSVPLRAFLRGLYGVVTTLRKMGRYEEALDTLEELHSYMRGDDPRHAFVESYACLPSL